MQNRSCIDSMTLEPARERPASILLSTVRRDTHEKVPPGTPQYECQVGVPRTYKIITCETRSEYTTGCYHLPYIPQLDSSDPHTRQAALPCELHQTGSHRDNPRSHAPRKPSINRAPKNKYLWGKRARILPRRELITRCRLSRLVVPGQRIRLGVSRAKRARAGRAQT